MTINYGVLKGTIVGHKRDADDDHYQILVSADDVMHRIAVNVKSSAPKAPSTLLFTALSNIPDAFTGRLHDLANGFTSIPSKPDSLALDYVRRGWFDTSAMVQVPPDKPGANNDLKDTLEDAVVKAIDQEGSVIYAFGSKWGPEEQTPDQYFKFLPGNGIHDIHMNQGNSGMYAKDNGIYHDGGLIFSYPDSTWQGYFFAFQSQTFQTDDNTGYPRDHGTGSPGHGKGSHHPRPTHHKK